MTGQAFEKPRSSGWGFFFCWVLLLSQPALASQGVAGSVAEDVLGAPLSIDGELVATEELQAAICLGPLRERWLDVFRLEAVAEKERRRRGLETTFRFLEESPFGFERNERQSWAGLVFVDTLRELFVPEDPADFPPASLACEESSHGRRMLMQVRMLHEQRAADPTLEMEEGEAELRDLFLQLVLNSLCADLVVEADPELLPEGVLVRIEDHALTLERLWPHVARWVTPDEVREAKKWVVNLRVLERAFTAAGVWYTAEERRQRSEAFLAGFETREQLEAATRPHAFPSLEAYLHYRLFGEAMYRLIKQELTPEVLEANFRERVAVTEGSAVDVDLLLFSAYDFERGTWRPDGWADAERRLKEALRELTEEGRSWIELLRESSDFPPSIGLSVRKQRRPPLRGEYPGSLRTHGYFDLMRTLEESTYTRFVNGGSITDLVFFELEVGAFGAPLAGRRGWMVPYLLERTPPLKRLVRTEVDSGRNRGIYVTRRLIEYLRERIAASDIRGL